MDGIKHRKALLKQLLRTFKITNIQAANAFPTASIIIGTWIHEMFKYFKPEVIEEVRNAKSRISISFDG